jgi:hypothetical protein
MTRATAPTIYCIEGLDRMRNTIEKLEYGAVSIWMRAGEVAAYLLCAALTLWEMTEKNIGGVAVFAMLTGIWFGFMACPCRVTKREWDSAITRTGTNASTTITTIKVESPFT